LCSTQRAVLVRRIPHLDGLNVGPKPIPLFADGSARTPLTLDQIKASDAYRRSPVVIRLELQESSDRTALGARVTHWRYVRFLIEATITEAAEPSGFAKFLGTALGNQKAAIEAYVKDQVTQSLDTTEAAKARSSLLKEASTFRDEYGAAFTEFVEAGKKFDAAPAGAEKQAAELTLTVKRAALRHKEDLVRAAFDRAGLPFQPMPVPADLT
jgi:hypothetical protein